MSATVSNTNYYVGGCIISSVVDTPSAHTTTLIDGFIQTSTTTTYPYVILVLHDWPWQTGTVQLNSTTGSYSLYYTSSGFAKASQGGEVSINGVTNSSVSGTFTFTCEDGTNVSGGAFSAKRLVNGH